MKRQRADNDRTQVTALHGSVMDIQRGIPTVTEAIEILQQLVQRKPEWAGHLLGVQIRGMPKIGAFCGIAYAEIKGGKDDGRKFVIVEGLD